MMLAISLAKLSDRERTIVNLRFVEGLTQSEIAARVGVSQMPVSRLLTTSLAELQSHSRHKCGRRCPLNHALMSMGGHIDTSIAQVAR